MVSISLCLPFIQISICTVYIPPNPDVAYFNQLIDFLLTLSSNCEFLIVIGDFNRPDICWSSLSGTSLLSILLCDFVFESNLSQLITCPTHVKGNILDILLTNNDHLISGLSVTESHSSLPSDHYIISFNIDLTSPSVKHHGSTFVFDYNNADYEGLCDYLLDSDFSVCLLSESIEQVWSFIKNTILEAMNLFIPKVKVKAKVHPKWFNSEIRHTIKCLRSLRRKCSLHPTVNNQSKLHSLEFQLNDLISSAKLCFENHLFMQKSNKIFRYIATLSSTTSVPSIVSSGTSIASDDYNKACLFNTFFYSVFTRSSFQIPPLEELPSPASSLSVIGISELDVFDALSSLDSSKAMGMDGIGPKVLKLSALALYKPIHHLFLLSLSQHYLPTDWRTHLIIPVFKSGDKSSTHNYRPISLLCTVSKLLERLIYDKICFCFSLFISVWISSQAFINSTTTGFFKFHP